jgi:hypothetical protein
MPSRSGAEEVSVPRLRIYGGTGKAIFPAEYLLSVPTRALGTVFGPIATDIRTRVEQGRAVVDGEEIKD